MKVELLGMRYLGGNSTCAIDRYQLRMSAGYIVEV
jgi:hypothetical protein